MSGQLGTIPYPQLYATEAQPADTFTPYFMQEGQPAAAPASAPPVAEASPPMPVVPIDPVSGKPRVGPGHYGEPGTPPQWLAMLYGGRQQAAPLPPGALQLGSVVYDASGVIGQNIPGQGYVPFRSTAPGAVAAPAAAPVAARPAAAPRAHPWFIPPPMTGFDQSRGVWRGPQGQQQLELSPPPLPYENWQQNDDHEATAQRYRAMLAS